MGAKLDYLALVGVKVRAALFVRIHFKDPVFTDIVFVCGISYFTLNWEYLPWSGVNESLVNCSRGIQCYFDVVSVKSTSILEI